jgi:hypothetical protein
MKSQVIETEVKQQLDLYYQQRADRLANLTLDVLLKKNLYLPLLIWKGDATKVIDELIEHYLQSYESWWHELLKDTTFCLHVVKLRSTFWDARYRYEDESVLARNRLAKAMIERFCNADYRLDWEKLLLMNQGY